MPDATDPTGPTTGNPAVSPADNALVPVLIPAPPAGETAEERIRRLEETVARLTRAVEPPQGYSPATLVPLPGPGGVGASPHEPESTRRWYTAIFRELRLIARMYLDPRYRLSRVAQFGVPAVLLLMVANYFFFAYACFCGVPIISHIGERVLNLIFAVIGYSILRRESIRYQAVLDYLARTGRG